MHPSDIGGRIHVIQKRELDIVYLRRTLYVLIKDGSNR